MDIEKTIHGFERSARFLSLGDERTKAIADSARSVIAASGQRASLNGTGVAQAARRSLSVAIMAVAATAVRKSDPAGIRTRHVRSVGDIARSISPGFNSRHVPGSTAAAPEDWTGAAGGPFSRETADGTILSVERIPGMPGGDWQALVDGIPAGHGETAGAAALNAERLWAAIAPPGCKSLPRRGACQV